MQSAAADSIREQQADQWRQVLFNAYTAGRFKRGMSFSALLTKFGLGYEQSQAKRPDEEPSADEALTRANRIMEAYNSEQ